ncbi:MAG: hypothetical protein KC897_02125 [Candidatus Omnitrophica bacterium]|nr:hypothetical protein [Candidatus Omnitrophota bacterium]MCB9719674.1 hypothetical protein [Candidatus Omnitrophota bacterium]
MPIANLDELINRIEDPRRFSKTERDEARQTLLAHPSEVLPALHERVRLWLHEFNTPEVRGLDARCQAAAQELAAMLGSPNHPGYLALYSQMECIKMRNALDIREAGAIAVIDLICAIGHPDSVAVLKEIIHGPWRDEMTWYTAAAGLVKMGDPEGGAYMRERILDPATRPGMRKAACRKLVELGVKDLFDPNDVIPGDPAFTAELEQEFVSRLRRV